jgi:hypothetical protein
MKAAVRLPILVYAFAYESVCILKDIFTTNRPPNARFTPLEEDSRLTPCDVGTGGGVKG